MNINDYVAGIDLPENGFNFCYTIERQLDGLGRIIGATAFKFGVYFGRTKNDETYEYRFAEKYGNSYIEAFDNVKEAIIKLLIAGENETLDRIAENILSPMFKGKILSTYYPDRYLNIFSGDHLNYFLTQLDLDTEKLISSDPVYKREALIEFKNQDNVMRNWSLDLFSNFVYSEYPGRPPKLDQSSEDTADTFKDYRTPSFPPNPSPEFIELSILPSHNSTTKDRKTQGTKKRRLDYEKEAKNQKKLGDRGEKIVKDLEEKRLKQAGRNDLADNIERVSLKSDTYGYDILSFETTGEKRLIEVKATRSNVGTVNFFFTVNEFQTALENKNYFIYIVFNVTSELPKVWAIKNPFNPKNKYAIMTPINFRVTINTIVKEQTNQVTSN
jgi:hypothetical protein